MKQDSPPIMLKTFPWLIVAWTVAFVTFNLVIPGSGGKVASFLMCVLAAPAVLLFGTTAAASWLLTRVEKTVAWQRLNLKLGVWQVALHIVAWLVIALAGVFLVLMSLFLLICFDNFNPNRTGHMLVLIATGTGLVLATFVVVFLSCRNGYSYLMTLLMAAYMGGCLWLWSLPGARGLIH